MKTTLFAPVSLVLAASLLVGCGANDQRATSSAALSSDSAQSEAAVAASFHEAMDSMSDTNASSGSSTALAFQGGVSAGAEVQTTMDRSCGVEDGKAVVTISSEKEISWERSNARIEVNASASIENDIVRTWSQEEGTVACQPNGQAAEIDFSADLTGYELDVAVKRRANRTVEKTLARSGETIKRTLTSVVEGTRHAVWLSQETQADGSISRNKSIRFSVSRSDNFVAKDGTVKDLSLAIASQQDLQVTVTWDKLSSGRQLLAKKISSGIIKASHAANSYVEASFNNILMKYENGRCLVASGSMEARFYAEGSTEALKIYSLTAANGTITVKDVTDPAKPQDVEDFDYSPCDQQDFNY